MRSRLERNYQHYQTYAQDVVVIFDNYGTETAAKYHERQRRGGAEIKEYNLTTNTLPLSREAVIRTTNNKKQLFNILSHFDFPAEKIDFVKPNQNVVQHEEADKTIISYMLQAAKAEAPVIRILSDDTDVFVLLVYWVWKSPVKAKVEMEKWDKTFLDVNTAVEKLGGKRGMLLGLHAMSGCDTVSYPFGKGKGSALKLLKDRSLPDLNKVLGEKKCHRKISSGYWQSIHPGSLWPRGAKCKI